MEGRRNLRPGSAAAAQPEEDARKRGRVEEPPHRGRALVSVAEIPPDDGAATNGGSIPPTSTRGHPRLTEAGVCSAPILPGAKWGGPYRPGVNGRMEGRRVLRVSGPPVVAPVALLRSRVVEEGRRVRGC